MKDRRRKTLWFADVHANLPAFEAVLSHAGVCDELFFLGDIVGYGPHPSACVDLLRQTGATAIQGNHDASVLAVSRRKGPRAQPVVWDEWTYDQLGAPQTAYLASMPSELNAVCCGMPARALHHPTGAPYLHPAMADPVLAQYVDPDPGTVIICGHSHRKIDRTIGGGRFVCLPSVGQPRDGDPRAGYAVEEDGVLSFHFVEYDLEPVVSAIKKIGLDDGFRRRWIQFLRTGRDEEWSRDYKG